MNIASYWVHGDFIIKILIITFCIVLIMSFEKIYQFYKLYKELKNLDTINSLEAAKNLPEGIMKNTLLEITSFKDDDKVLLNSFIGVKLDLIEQYSMRFVTLIGVIAILSPMLGLIGTFIGVWHVFDGVGDIGLNDPAVIAKGIKEVIVDTMAGLILAVVAMVFYKIFEFFSTKIVSLFEEKIYRLLRGHNA
ncbi:MotA/TolQ/ExbB proton channel family protein [Sulfurimonas sp.]|uniref:MotA/TolQ/ExbB proton channel family protein n=1 Tax=Sulfurimonas sp. TaxID=2022749 RepID=UPI003D0D38EB